MPVIEITEPFPEVAWPRVWAWMQPVFRHVADDYAPQTLAEFVPFSAALALRSRTWGIYRDGELGGVIVFEPLNPVTGLAHIICRKDFWGSKTTSPAAIAFLKAVFASGVKKVSGMVFADNRAARAFAGRFGGKQEGLLRRQTMRGFKPVDVILCGLTEEEFNNGVISGNRVSARGEKQFIVQPDNDIHDGEQLLSRGKRVAKKVASNPKRRPGQTRRRRSTT